MDTSTLDTKLNKLFGLIKQKERDIANRRDALMSKLNSPTTINKLKGKIETIQTKVSTIEEKEEKQLNYFMNEVKDTRLKYDKEIEKIKTRMELQIETLQEKADHYIEYCNSQISNIRDQSQKAKELLENKKEKINIEALDEDSDVIITKMKGELKDLNNKHDEIQTLIDTVNKEQKAYMKQLEENALREVKQREEQDRRDEERRRKEHLQLLEQQRKERIEQEEKKYKEREEDAKRILKEEEEQKLLKDKVTKRYIEIKKLIGNDKELSKAFNFLSKKQNETCNNFETVEQSYNYLLQMKEQLLLIDEWDDEYYYDGDQSYFPQDIWDKYLSLSNEIKWDIYNESNKQKKEKLIKKFSK